MSKPPHLWEKSYPSDIKWSFKAPHKAVHLLLEETALKYPDRICADFLGKTSTYKEIHQLSQRIAKGLQHIGIQKGDKVAICLPNCPYFVAVYYAALQIGATVVNFNPLYTEDEIATQLKDCEAKVVFTLNLKALYEKLGPALKKTPLEHIIVCPFTEALPTIKSILFRIFKGKELQSFPKEKGNIKLSDLINHGDKPEKVDINPEKDIALYQYTGGTTGLPKGAMLSHSNVVSNVEQVKLWVGDLEEGGERVLAVIPFFHVFAMTAIMNFSIATGSRIIMLPRFELETLLKTIHKTKPTLFHAVPTIFSKINTFENIEKFNLSSIRFSISGGAALPAYVRETFEKRANCKVLEGYGLSESSPVAACNPRHTGGKNGSIGLPFPGTEIEIRDLEDMSKKLPPLEQGELFIKGPQVMQGYWKRDDATKETLVDGWLRTGDVGYMDEDGFVFITDRIKDIIISSGYNIYPRMIEDAFYKHIDVEEVIVIAIPHPHKGEVPKAFVKLEEGSTTTEEALLTFVNKHLNPLERPAAIEFRDELPKTLIGKLSKKELVEEENLKIKLTETNKA